MGPKLIRLRGFCSVAISFAALFALSSCGGGKTSHSAIVSPSSVKTCLTAERLRVIGGPVNASSRGASGVDEELIVDHTFIAFYPSAAIAAQHQKILADNAARLQLNPSTR